MRSEELNCLNYNVKHFKSPKKISRKAQFSFELKIDELSGVGVVSQQMASNSLSLSGVDIMMINLG